MLNEWAKSKSYILPLGPTLLNQPLITKTMKQPMKCAHEISKESDLIRTSFVKSQHLTRAKKRNCLWKIEHSKVTRLVYVTHKTQKLNWYENKTYTCCIYLIYGCRAYVNDTNKSILTIKISNTTQKLELITIDNICIWN